MKDINLKDLDNEVLAELLGSLEGLKVVLDEVEGECNNGKNNE